MEVRRGWVEENHPQLSLKEQCELLGLARSTYYYERVLEDEEDARLKVLIDKEYLEHPFYGSRRISIALKEAGNLVGRKRVQRLMEEMGLEAIYPKPRTSVAGSPEVKFPYLLRGLGVKKRDQVWCADITYIPLKGGYGYCVVIMDWWSRYVLAWRVSNSMDVEFCLEALEEALGRGKPTIFNTDQGSQFTSQRFIGALLEAGVSISWDGRGRAMDNIFIERLWRSLKYEEVYLKEYGGLVEARESVGRYFMFYNMERPHQSLQNQTPQRYYVGGGCQ